MRCAQSDCESRPGRMWLDSQPQIPSPGLNKIHLLRAIQVPLFYSVQGDVDGHPEDPGKLVREGHQTGISMGTGLGGSGGSKGISMGTGSTGGCG